MADPTVQSFCCRRPQTHFLMATDTLMNEFSTKPYLVTSLFCSAIGMVGAMYQILIRYVLNREADYRLYYLQTMRYFRVPKRLLAQNVGKKIIVWLAVADFLACGGVFVRSTFWMYVRPNGTNVVSENSRIVFCAVVSGLIQYFYTCTWLWTLCYSFNIRTYLKDDVIAEKKYHSFVWPTAAVLTGIGTTVLYYPNADCHNFQDMFTALTRVLPNYCATYLPILLVMVINPIVYHSASNTIDADTASSSSQYSPAERHINATLRWKFLMINFIFYICWLPNLICGITLWASWHTLPEKFLIPIWYIMAIFNPLQAFFNTLVYRKWHPTSSGTSSQSHSPGLRPAFGANDPMGERAPLLQYPQLNSTKPTAPSFHQL